MGSHPLILQLVLWAGFQWVTAVFVARRLLRLPLRRRRLLTRRLRYHPLRLQ